MQTRMCRFPPGRRLISLVLVAWLGACAGPTADDRAATDPEPARQTTDQKATVAQPTMPSDVRSRLNVHAQARYAAEHAAGYHPWVVPPPTDRERYGSFDDNPVHLAASDPVSTFSIDVDTASYSRMRRFLALGQLPQVDAVRTEELINYFDYGYAVPDDPARPFAVHLELGPSPWHAERRLLRIGLKGFERDRTSLPPANLVFLVDVSGSMQGADRLDLLKASLGLLVRQLRAEDRIAVAVYAGAAGMVLPPTPGNERAKILAALDALEAGGSTNGGAGIELAYNLARQAFAADGINRVILATDGDFNVGTVDDRALKQLVERQRADGIGLTVLGFGTGNYNDALMQTLAQHGNGNAAYIDTLSEARKVLVEQLAGTLEIIAQDVKIQVEFNPAQVAEYRLVGYETRHLAREDFNNDRVDAGDIGAGHSVTALYEITPVGADAGLIDPLRYQRPASVGDSDEIAFVRLRYKRPGETVSRLIEHAVRQGDGVDRLARTSDDFRFAAAVAGFGQLLRGGRYTGDLAYADVLALARNARGADPFGYRGEFIGLVSTAAALAGATTGRP
jgi:Ca-activated chloride channel homolog